MEGNNDNWKLEKLKQRKNRKAVRVSVKSVGIIWYDDSILHFIVSNHWRNVRLALEFLGNSAKRVKLNYLPNFCLRKQQQQIVVIFHLYRASSAFRVSLRHWMHKTFVRNYAVSAGRESFDDNNLDTLSQGSAAAWLRLNVGMFWLRFLFNLRHTRKNY